MPKTKRAIVIILYLACLSGLLLQVSNLYARYMQRNMQVSQTEVPKKDLLFPAITLCVDFWTDKATLCAMFNNNCTKRSMRIYYTLFNQNIRADLRNQTSFASSRLFSCSIKGSGSCLKSGELACAQWMHLSTYRRPLQMCYTLDVATVPNITTQCDEPWLLELQIISRITRKQTIVFMKSDLIPVIALEPQTSPMAEIANIDLRPGYRHVISIKQQLIKRLPAPFESDCIDYRALGFQHLFSGFFSRESCLQQCFIESEMRMCGCITYTYEFIGSFGHYPICMDTQRGFEYCKDNLITSVEYQECFRKCRAPCREIRYDLKLASIAPMSNMNPADKESHFEVKFRFASNNVEQLDYSAMITPGTVLAYIGGSFGVWIGVSTVDIATWMLDMLLAVFTKYCCRRR